jgi:hypothetical protein
VAVLLTQTLPHKWKLALHLYSQVPLGQLAVAFARVSHTEQFGPHELMSFGRWQELLGQERKPASQVTAQVLP